MWKAHSALMTSAFLAPSDGYRTCKPIPTAAVRVLSGLCVLDANGQSGVEKSAS